MSTRLRFVLLFLLSWLTAACGGQSDPEREIAVAVALTQTAAAVSPTPAPATPTPEPAAPTPVVETATAAPIASAAEPAPATGAAATPAPTAATSAAKTVTVRIDPAQAPPASVVIYADMVGDMPDGPQYYTVEGSGQGPLTLELPFLGYFISGYSLDPNDPSYFAAWAPEGGLAYVDTPEVMLQRPPDPCDRAFHLEGSPDGRFPATYTKGMLMRRNCVEVGPLPTETAAETSPAAAPVTAPATDFDPNMWYRLTNQFLGEGRALDTYADGENAPFMGQTGDYSGQLWKLTAIGDSYYRLTNQFLGDGRALDTYGDGENAPFMGQAGDYSGQFWQLTPVGDGYYRLTNQFLGAGRALDTLGDGENAPFMGQAGDFSGQLWRLTPVQPIQ